MNRLLHLTMTDFDVGHLRLYSQRIAGRRLTGPDEVVRWLGAIQAQDYHQAVWAIGLRTEQSMLADIEKAVAERKIVRTWPLRGTIHFVPAEDAKWMLQLSAARTIAADRRRLEQLGLDDETMRRARLLFYDALAGGRQLPRSTMMKVLEEAGIGTEGQRGYHILWYTAQTGLTCLGPMQDKEQTFVLLDEWVPRSRVLSREESLAELARRYYTSHGPATIHDFARWAGLTVTDARTGLDSVRSQLASAEMGGNMYWMADHAPDRIAGDQSRVYLLPGFDEYLLGYKDRNAVLQPQHASRVVPGGNGVFLPMIVVDGRIIGTWKRKVKKKVVELTLSPFVGLEIPGVKAIEAARRYGSFLGLPLIISMTGANG